MPKRLSFADAALLALKSTGKPMTCVEMIAWAKKQGVLVTKGQTPNNTLNAVIARSLKNDRNSPFKKASRGYFALARRSAR